jgi:serine/threonine-protein kinase RsbW/sigma-B regulation protein RsbU (phosphoserine phosphatase)
MPTLSLQVANDFSALAPVSQQVREFLCACCAPPEAEFLTDLVIEELVTNTIKYGYDDKDAHHIQVSVSFHDGHLCIEVRDNGHPFDPLTQEAPDLTQPAEERPIGGLGIHLVRQMTDEVRYERRGDENIVTATKSFADGQ